jgi:hypothetical protein
MAARGLSVPTYAYALNNPVKNTDRDGLRILASLTTLPPVFGPTNCPDVTNGGSLPGCTRTWLSAPIKVGSCYRGAADLRCSAGANGAWKFDVSLKLNIQSQYDSPDVMNASSSDSPGLTLGEHEELHRADVRDALHDINSAINTEGFGSQQACNAARASVIKALEDYYGMSAVSGRILRDQHL